MNKKLIIYIASIITVLLVIVVGHYSYGYYSSKSSGISTARVASFILSIDEDTLYFPYDLSRTNPTSGVKYYKFEITNKKNSRVSEVKEKYTLHFSSTRNVPLDIELYKVNKSTYDSTTNSNFNTSGATLIQKVIYPNNVDISNINTFNANVSSSDYYIAKVSWNSSYDSELYQGKIDLLKIKADYEQIS